jgi:hypothetical protein
VKDFATSNLKKKDRMKKYYADWQQTFGIEEVFMCFQQGGGHLL